MYRGSPTASWGTSRELVRALGQVRGMGQRGTGHPAPPGTRCRCGQLEVTEHMLDGSRQAVKGWVLGAVWAAEPRPAPEDSPVHLCLPHPDESVEADGHPIGEQLLHHRLCPGMTETGGLGGAGSADGAVGLSSADPGAPEVLTQLPAAAVHSHPAPTASDTHTDLRSISLGFLATYWATRSLSRVRRMSVKYSSFPCRATVSREAT